MGAAIDDGSRQVLPVMVCVTVTLNARTACAVLRNAGLQ